jgi:hypothetical protein
MDCPTGCRKDWRCCIILLAVVLQSSRNPPEGKSLHKQNFLGKMTEEIADLRVGLTVARKTWGFGLCFPHLRTV